MGGIILILFVAMIFLYAFHQEKIGRSERALILLMLGGAVLRIWVGADPFLHEWDERYHALVAKNLIKHPWRPTLYDTPILPFDYKDWGANHIWLSKPPIPLWIMALSMSFFGVDEMGLRIPSFLFSTIGILLTFQLGRFLFSRKTGFVAAFFHAIHGLWIEVSGGRLSSDHVDTLFLLCFELSMLFLVFFLKKKETRYLFFFGFMAGIAYMCKYSVSFFLLMIWLCQKIYSEKIILKNYKQLAFVFIPFVVIAIPWQIYIFLEFPTEAKWMYQQIFVPVTTSIQGHGGSIFYYAYRLGSFFGEFIYLPLAWLTYKFFTSKNNWKIQIMFFWIMIPLLLFSIAATKRHTYILICAPAIFILTALFLEKIGVYIKKVGRTKFPAYVVSICLVLLPIRYSIERIKPFDKKLREQPEWLESMNNFVSKNKGNSSKIILINEQHSIETMFYTDFIAYPVIPSDQTIQNLKAEGFKIYINHGGTYYLQ